VFKATIYKILISDDQKLNPKNVCTFLTLKKSEFERPDWFSDSFSLHFEIRIVPLDSESFDDLQHEDRRLQLGEPAPDTHSRPVTEGQKDEWMDLLVVWIIFHPSFRP